jgi:hypothetical protein
VSDPKTTNEANPPTRDHAGIPPEDREDPNETASEEIAESLATESNLPDPPREDTDSPSESGVTQPKTA